MSDPFTPRPEHRFTFGLWTVGNRGRDPFGSEVRPPLDPVDAVEHLSELGAYGVSLHDNDLVPVDSTSAQRQAIIKDFRRALDTTGMQVPMVTTNLFFRPVFKEGALTANDPRIRRFAVRKACEAATSVQSSARRSSSCGADAREWKRRPQRTSALALDRYKEGIDLICEYIETRGLGLRIALEPKPNEPRGDILLPTVGHTLAFIGALERPDMVGLNPEFAHETMSGLSFTHAVAQTLVARQAVPHRPERQRIGKFDQDFRFGSEGIRDAFYVVKLLEDAAWQGMRHFDAHPYRTEDPEGVWDFARGCMRTYLVLADKARRFQDDPEIQEALRTARSAELWPSRPDRRTGSKGSSPTSMTKRRWPTMATGTNASTSS